MTELFLNILNRGIAVSWLIGLVTALRFIFRKLPKRSHMIFWGIVGLRLVLPFSPESIFSLIPSAQTFAPEEFRSGTFHVHTGVSLLDTGINGYLKAGPVKEAAVQTGSTVSSTAGLMDVLCTVWIFGMILLLGYAFFSYFRLKRKVSASIPYQENVCKAENTCNAENTGIMENIRNVDSIHISDDVDAPFILGVWRPKIYLPSGMDAEILEYVLAHEKAHLKRRDHIWKMLGYLLLCVYWFNPLAWAAYLLLGRDIELACDEKVVMDLDLIHRKAYASALVDCSMQKRLVTVCPLAFGEIGVKERVTTVLKYKKPAFFAVIFSVILCMAVGIAFLTNPKTGAESSEKTENGKATKEEESERKNTETENEAEVEIEVRQPEISLSDSTGADPTELLYSDKDILIFSGCYGLFAYSKSTGEIVSALSLPYLGCDKTQGDNYCEKVVSEDGKTAYLHPLSEEKMYVYEIREGKLFSRLYDKALFEKLGKAMQEKWVVRSDDTGESVDRGSMYWYEGDRKRETSLRNTSEIGSLCYTDYKWEEHRLAANCWYPLFSPDGFTGAVDFAPEDIHDIVSADLWIGTDEPGLKETGVPVGKLLHCADKEILSELEKKFSGASAVGGSSACPFYTALYLTRSDGTVGTVFPATDSCDCFVSGSTCYDVSKKPNDWLWMLVKRFEVVSGDAENGASVKQTDRSSGYLDAWAQAFSGRDAGEILAHTTKKVQKSLRSRELLMGKGEQASFGLSSPWPVWKKNPDGSIADDAEKNTQYEYAYRIISHDSSGGDILYYALALPFVSVWQEHIEWTSEDGKFMVTKEEMNYLDEIKSGKEFDTAYPSISQTPMDYKRNGLGDALCERAVLSSSWLYKDLSMPENAARILLHLADDQEVQIKVLEHTEKTAKLELFFGQDQETRTIKMIKPWKSDVWIPQDI